MRRGIGEGTRYPEYKFGFGVRAKATAISPESPRTGQGSRSGATHHGHETKNHTVQAGHEMMVKGTPWESAFKDDTIP
jgi:hypothetical protein